MGSGCLLSPYPFQKGKKNIFQVRHLALFEFKLHLIVPVSKCQ